MRAKGVQKTMLHDSSSFTLTASDAVDVPVSVSSSAASAISSLPCPNPSHPISCTTDLWGGPDHESYICLTASWLDANWDLQHALLDIYLCTDRHTGENLAEWLKQIWQENDISVRCVIPFLPLLSVLAH